MTRPVIGAALMIDEIDTFRDWLLERPRDIEIQDFWNVALLEGDWRSAVHAALQHLDGHQGRLGIHGPFWGFTIASLDPDVRALVRRRLDQALDVAEALGADQIVIHSPFTTWDAHNLDAYPEGRMHLIDAVADTLAPALGRAESAGIHFVLENIEDKDPADRIRLAEALGWQALAISLDTGHAHYAHVSTGAPPVDFYVRAAGARLAHVHLQDTDGYADRHWAIGKGSIHWDSVLEAIVDLSPHARLVLELHRKDGIPASFDFLRARGLVE